MPDNLQYRAPAPDTFDEIARILSLAFAGTVEGSREWIEKSGPGNLRVLHDDSPEAPGPIAATLLRIPMGHFVGGRSAPCVGIAGVAVPPERRGGGLASRLMREAVREIEGQGIGLSSLYPATQPLYRAVGFEQAWHRFEYSIPLARVRVDPPDPPAWRGDPADAGVRESIRAVYARSATAHNALIDRPGYMWNRIFSPRDGAASVLLFGHSRATPDAYVVFTQHRDPRTGRHDVAVHDAASATPAGWARTLGALGRFRTTGENLRFFAGPTHPWLNLDRDQAAIPHRAEAGMLRITNVASALRARGYNARVNAEVTLSVRDDTIPGNAGLWSLSVRDAQAEVRRLASPTQAPPPQAVRLSINALAAMYTSFLTPRQAGAIGWAEGPDEALDALGAMLAGPAPWMPEQF